MADKHSVSLAATYWVISRQKVLRSLLVTRLQGRLREGMHALGTAAKLDVCDSYTDKLPAVCVLRPDYDKWVRSRVLFTAVYLHPTASWKFRWEERISVLSLDIRVLHIGVWGAQKLVLSKFPSACGRCGSVLLSLLALTSLHFRECAVQHLCSPCTLHCPHICRCPK
jgi:hypothetical protein